MANFANSFKSEIARIARKETKAEFDALRKTAATSRSEIAALKKQLKDMQSTLKQVTESALAKSTDSEKKEIDEEVKAKPGRKPRNAFGPEQFLQHRKSLGITQAQMAKLLDASTLSVLNWETGKVVPRASQLVKIAEVRKLGKREVLKRLDN